MKISFVYKYSYTSTGTQLANYLYNAWGGESESSTSDWATENPIRYNGQYLDNETGFYYLRARYYDPSIHRFTSEDPAEDGLNWYAYCSNNPVMFSDPSGYITEEMSMYENNQIAPAAYTNA